VVWKKKCLNAIISAGRGKARVNRIAGRKMPEYEGFIATIKEDGKAEVIVQPETSSIVGAPGVSKKVCHCASSSSQVTVEALNPVQAAVGDRVAVRVDASLLLRNARSLACLSSLWSLGGRFLSSFRRASCSGCPLDSFAFFAVCPSGLPLGFFCTEIGNPEDRKFEFLQKTIFKGILKDDGYFSSISPLKRIRVAENTYDLGEYLAYLHMELLKMIPGITLEAISGAFCCCGLAGVMGFKREFYETSVKGVTKIWLTNRKSFSFAPGIPAEARWRKHGHGA
jgi:hypothetical protein